MVMTGLQSVDAQPGPCFPSLRTPSKLTLCADGNDPVELNMSIPTNASTKDAFM